MLNKKEPCACTKKTSAQTVSNLKQQVPPLTSKPGKGMRIVCLSDTHFPPDGIQVPDGDVLIVAGDICLRGHDYELELFDCPTSTILSG